MIIGQICCWVLFQCNPDPYIFVNETSTGAITTKTSNKFKLEGFDEIK